LASTSASASANTATPTSFFLPSNSGVAAIAWRPAPVLSVTVRGRRV